MNQWSCQDNKNTSLGNHLEFFYQRIRLQSFPRREKLFVSNARKHPLPSKTDCLRQDIL